MKHFQMLPVVALLFTLSLGAVPAAAQTPAAPAQAEGEGAAPKKIDPTLEKEIRKLLRVSKGNESGGMILDGMLNSLKRSMSTIPESFWKELPRKDFLERFDEELVRIYAQHLTLEEVRGLIKFYESPLGKSALEKMRLISMDAAKAGHDFSSDVLRWVMDEAEKKGVLPNVHGH